VFVHSGSQLELRKLFCFEPIVCNNPASSRPCQALGRAAKSRRLCWKLESADERYSDSFRSGSEVGVDAGGCSAARATARCACRSRRIWPPPSRLAAPASAAKRGCHLILPERLTVDDAAVPEIGEERDLVEGPTLTRFDSATGTLGQLDSAGCYSSRSCVWSGCGDEHSRAGACAWRHCAGGDRCPACAARTAAGTEVRESAK
jgi:hypothetical protein